MNGNKLITVLLFSISAACFGGAWGVGSFQNDSALDWAYELESSASPKMVRSALTSVQAPGYKEVDACSAALAAAEIVASVKSGEFESLPEGVSKWAKSNFPSTNDAFIQDAKRAVAVCTDQTESELAQLWGEAADGGWAIYVSDLKSRLSQNM